VLGTAVDEIVRGNFNQGKYRVNFNASNLSSCVYFYRIQSGNFISTNKMIFMK